MGIVILVLSMMGSGTIPGNLIKKVYTAVTKLCLHTHLTSHI